MNRLPILFLLFLFASALFPACDCSDENDGNNNVQIEPDAGTTDVGEDLSNDHEPDLPDVCESCREDQVCVDDNSGDSVCQCPSGSTESDGSCEQDQTCQPTTCNERGTCTESPNGPSCECETGWTGEFCDQCDSANGWSPDGVGGCTDDLCTTIQCDVEQLCEIENGNPTCVCPPGTTANGNGGCDDDVVCTPNTCAGNGTCVDEASGPVCNCDEGFALPNCQMCDTAAGYHPDGMGGCTTDPCLPNPCGAPNQSICTSDGTTATCGCDVGYHLEGNVCVIDETCLADSCTMHGTCDDSTGVISCTCDIGYIGDDCSMCDAANGYHDDGSGTGTCTNDICLPNPCDQIPNKTVCVEQNGATMCQCEGGFHDDGFGGCTTDPCLPDLCAANNQACRVTNGLPECYTPVCNDDNPCTDDALVNGVCVYTPVVDGSACATDSCTIGEVCTAGVCGGGSPRICDDGNACTDDSCDPNSGCLFTDDDTNIPDDGIACTDGVCSAGFESHVPNDALCDNGLFCDGIEQCVPADPMSDASGCITNSVPVAPPNPSPCQTYGACDETTDDFPLTTASAGSPCNDGVYCTTGDVCDAAGACTGTFINGCGGGPLVGDCVSTTPYNGIDVPTTALTTNITVNGTPLANLVLDGTNTAVYAVDRATGNRHVLATWNSSSTLLSQEMISGTYDLMYRRGVSSEETYSYRNDGSDSTPNGLLFIQKDVVIPAGAHTLNIDVPTTTLTTNITVDGTPLANLTLDGTNTAVYAVNRDTGNRHVLATWNSSSTLLSQEMISGTYDLMYRRGVSSQETYSYRNDGSDSTPNGLLFIQKDVVIPAGAHTLDIDVPTTALTTNITIDGTPLANLTLDGTNTAVYAVNRDTGNRHVLATWNSSSTLLSEEMIAGTYDLMYRRGVSSQETYSYRNDGSDSTPNGLLFIQKDVVIPAGTQTLNIDVPTTTLTTNITVDGTPLANLTLDGTNTAIYAVNRDTGNRHVLATWNSSSTLLSEEMISGTYDLMYRRGVSSQETYSYRNDGSDSTPNGMLFIQKDVVISAGADTLNIDVPTVLMTTPITINGAALASIVLDGTNTAVYAVNRDTGNRHVLATWNSSSTLLSEEMISGTYDLMYRRGVSSQETYSYRNDGSDSTPNGMLFLNQCVRVQ